MLPGQFARRAHRGREFAQAGRHGGGEIAALERLGDGADDARAGQNILGATGESERLRVVQGVRKARIDQHQVGKTHGFHGARNAADIAGPTSLDQNKAQPFEKRRTGFGQVHLK